MCRVLHMREPTMARRRNPREISLTRPKTWPHPLGKQYARVNAAARKAKSRGRMDLHASHVQQLNEIERYVLALHQRQSHSEDADHILEAELNKEAAVNEMLDAASDAADAD